MFSVVLFFLSLTHSHPRQSLPAISELTKDKIADFVAGNKVVVIGFFAAKESDSSKNFASVANKLRDDFVFGTTIDAAAAKEQGVNPPAFIVFKKFDEGKNIFTGKFEVDEIVNFVKINSIPLVDDIGPDNYQKYIDSGLPMAYVFYSSEEEKTKIAPEVEPVAKHFKGKISFVYIDAIKYGGHASNLNLKDSWPAFGIHQTKDNIKFPYPQDESAKIDSASLTEFCDKFIDGQLKPSVKSQPEPESNDGSVKIIVGTNYHKIVNDPSKDVLIELYATWCGHCKKVRIFFYFFKI